VDSIEKTVNVSGPTISKAGNPEVEILKELREQYGIHLFRLPTPIPTLKTNTYFAEGPVPTLIDVPADSPPFLTELDDALRTLGYSINDIKIIIVTHPHSDHCGSARTIADKSGAEIWAIRDTAVHMANFEHECNEEEEFTASSLKSAGIPADSIDCAVRFFRRMADYTRDVTTSHYLEESETVLFSSCRLRIERVPGHTPWCIMLWDNQSGIAFTGDFLLKDISPNPLMQRPGKVAPGYRRLKTFIASLERVRQMNLRFALPGHGDLIENPSRRIVELVRFIEERRRMVIATLKKRCDQTPFDLMKSLFPGLPREQSFLAISEISAYLEVLRDEGTVMKIEGLPVRYRLN
jgi:glyoxylase-like metal-dependent hydrolase (beta-lactamase superfamily II)